MQRERKGSGQKKKRTDLQVWGEPMCAAVCMRVYV